jgi:di/tricarboxylate transporter
MKTKLAHHFAGLTLGLVCYAIYLSLFLMLNPHQMLYMAMPMYRPDLPNEPSNYLWAYLHYLRLAKSTEIIVVLTGLPIPLITTVLARRRADKRPLAWLSRWSVQLPLAILCLLSALYIASTVFFMIPPPPLWMLGS